MGKKIIVLNGSPRENGNTASLIKEFKIGAEENGNEVKVFNLQNMNINPCLGCCNGGKDKNINLILKKEPTEIEWLNINDVLKHLKDDNYIVVLNEDGRINIWTNLEYDQCQFNKQEKK